MKNIWKERWNKCPKLMMNKCLTRYSDKLGLLLNSVYTCGIKPLRKDAESEVKEVAPGFFEVKYEAPNTEDDLQGLAVRSLIQVFKRGSREYIKVVEVRKFFPHADAKYDYYILEEWDKAMKVTENKILEEVVEHLKAAVK